jgi:hypothetical protein
MEQEFQNEMQATSPVNEVNLIIDDGMRFHLDVTRKWTMFFAVIQFVGSFFMVILAIVMIFRYLNPPNFDYGFNRYSYSPANSPGLIVIAIVYLVMAVVVIFPGIYLYNFSVKIKTALMSNDQSELGDAFYNLKRYYVFSGILLIVGLSLMLLSLFMSAALLMR